MGDIIPLIAFIALTLTVVAVCSGLAYNAIKAVFKARAFNKSAGYVKA